MVMTNPTEPIRLSTDDRLRQIAEALERGEESPLVRVRAFLEWFGAMRRGAWIVYGIRNALKRAALVTEPDFELVDIDASIRFAPEPVVVEASGTSNGTASVSADAVLVTEQSAQQPVSIGIGDPTY